MIFQTNGHCCETDWNLSFPDAMSIQIYLNMKMRNFPHFSERMPFHCSVSGYLYEWIQWN